jgi:hypothetical protein
LIDYVLCGETIRQTARRALEYQLRLIRFVVTAQDNNYGFHLGFDCDSDEKPIVK